MDSSHSLSDNGSVGLEKLGRDNLELVCCFLPYFTVVAFTQCSRETRADGESEAVWRAQLGALAEDYPEGSAYFQSLFSEISAGSSARSCYKKACYELRSWQRDHALRSWAAADNSSLLQLGAPVDANTGRAQFVPFEPIT